MDYDGPLGSVRLQKGNAGYRPSLFNLLKVTLPRKYPTVRSIDPCKIKHLEDFLDIMTVSRGQYLQYIVEQQKELTRNDTVEDEEDMDILMITWIMRMVTVIGTRENLRDRDALRELVTRQHITPEYY
ncbi:hypothetical protein Pmani_015652 [Petrolisthes manimaculis]|uniref:Uncharacterized protein n=1 Tax=Petrolisthes manimaculis TaxID=1843537 RepID=A0AAE1PTH9_9EUCA|nr:hypothetical protein Pmani_015652 [Petrolisthes manimaculis]